MNPLPTSRQIITQLQAEKHFLNQKFGVVHIGLFGSFAKGRQNRNSDIDLLVELKEPRFDWIAGLQIHLEKKFNRKIGLIRKGNPANQCFEEKIEKEILYA
jgi:predicted nucleotidyltransferase